MRRASKVDDNQREIVEAFRECGYSVYSTAACGKGFPDLAIGKNGKTTLIEVKDGRKVPSKRKLTDDERVFHALWKGSLEIIESVNDVLAFDLRSR